MEQVFNYICKSGGFVELSVLLRNLSLLGIGKSEPDAINWLKTRASRRVVVVKDYKGEIIGVRVVLRKKICLQYLDKGSCRRAQGKCKFWHICKGFIEGSCDGKCRLSHDFFDKDNAKKTKEFAVEKLSNEIVKNIVKWSLPQVCQLYLRCECKLDKCPYLHICAQVVRRRVCDCALSHNIVDSYNKEILKEHDLLPDKSMKFEFVCCNILVCKEHSVSNKSKHTREGSNNDEKATAGALSVVVDPMRPNTVEQSAQMRTPTNRGAVEDTSNTAPQQDECNTAPQRASAVLLNSSTQSESRRNLKVNARSADKYGKPKQLQDKIGKHEANSRPTNSISDSNILSVAPSRNEFEFLNVETKEKEDCSHYSSDRNNFATFTFKADKPIKNNRKECNTTIQSSDLATVMIEKEVEKDRKGFHGHGDLQAKNVEDANAIKRKPLDCKTLTQGLECADKAKAEEVENVSWATQIHNVSQKKSSEDANAAKRRPKKAKTTTKSLVLAVKSKVTEVQKESGTVQIRKTPHQKYLQDSTVPERRPRESKMTAQGLDSAVKANVEEVQNAAESAQKLIEPKRKRLKDSTAPKRKPQEFKMPTQGIENAVKPKVEEVQSPESAQLHNESKLRKLQGGSVLKETIEPKESTVISQGSGVAQRRSESQKKDLEDKIAVKRGSQKSKMTAKCLNQAKDKVLMGKHSGTAQARSELQQKRSEDAKIAHGTDSAVRVNVKEVQKDPASVQTPLEPKQERLKGSSASKRRPKESKMTTQDSSAAVTANVEEFQKHPENVQSLNESNPKRFQDSSASKKISKETKMTTRDSNTFVKTNIEELGKNRENAQSLNDLNPKRFQDSSASKKISKEIKMTTRDSNTFVKPNVEEVRKDRENAQSLNESNPKRFQDSNASKRRPKESKMAPQGSNTAVTVNIETVQKDPDGVQTLLESKQKRFHDSNASMRRPEETKMTAQGPNTAVEAKVEDSKKDPEGVRTHSETKQKCLHDANAPKRRPKKTKMNAQDSNTAVEVKNEETKNDPDTVQSQSEPKRLQDENAPKKVPKGSKMTTLDSMNTIKAKVEEVKKEAESAQTPAESKQKCLRAAGRARETKMSAQVSDTAETTNVYDVKKDPGIALKLSKSKHKCLLDGNASKRRPHESKMTDTDVQPEVKEEPNDLKRAQSNDESKQKILEGLHDAKGIYSANATPAIDSQMLPVSSSCNNVQVPKKGETSEKAVFDCILKEYNGSVSFEVIIKRHDLFPRHNLNGLEDIATWFRARKHTFLLREKEGTILEVSVICRKARLCFNQKCSKKSCKYVHVCKDFIAGFCLFGVECGWNHSFQYDENRNLISKLKLGGLAEENLRKILQLSMPHVCLDYNNGYCAEGLSCRQIHICKDFVRERCEDEESCGLQHESTLLSLHATAILQNYGLKCTGGNVSSVLKMLLVCADNFPGGSSDCRNYTASINVASKESNRVLSNSSKGGAVGTCREPSELKVFECICSEYDCSASFSVISERRDLFPCGFNDVESWFRKKKGSFLITEDDKGMISQVAAYSTKARLCLRYNSGYYGECKRKNCSYLHVCREYITESCSNGRTCPRNHHFQDERDKALLSKIKLDQFTDEELRKLVLSSTPWVCEDYNNGMCDRRESCNRVHICSDHLKKCCREESGCDLDHESAMDTKHTQTVLERYHLQHLDSHLLQRIILVCKQPPEANESGKYNQMSYIDSCLLSRM